MNRNNDMTKEQRLFAINETIKKLRNPEKGLSSLKNFIQDALQQEGELITTANKYILDTTGKEKCEQLKHLEVFIWHIVIEEIQKKEKSIDKKEPAEFKATIIETIKENLKAITNLSKDQLETILNNYDEQREQLNATPEIFMKYGFTTSCTNSAAAFIHEFTKSYPGTKDDVKFMFTTVWNHLLDGSSGHTVPCVKLNDNEWAVIEPRNETIPKDTFTKIISDDEFQVGKPFKHLMSHRNSEPYMITAILDKPYTNHEEFLEKASRVRPDKEQEFINSLDEIIMIANGAHSGVYVDPKKPDEIIKQSKSNNGGSYIAQQKTGYDIIEQIKKSGYATGAQLPTLISISEINGVPSIKEKRISGNTFDRDDMLWKSMDTRQKQNAAKQMAMFLVAMHSTGEIQQPKKSIKTMFDNSKLKSATDMINAFDGAMPEILANKLKKAEQYLESTDISDEFHVLTHKDLRIQNLMYDKKTQQLSVLDFELAGTDNIYHDFIAFASSGSMPWGFTRLVIDEYNKIQPKKYPLKINPEKVQNMLLYAAMHEYSRNVRPEQNKEISTQEKQKAFEHIVKNINRITGFNISLDLKKLFEQGQNNIADLADKKQQNVATGSYEYE